MPDDQRATRVLAIASGGGHWVQLMRLRPAFADLDVSYATVNTSYRDDIGPAPFYIIPDATRWNMLVLVKAAIRVLWIMLRIRPDVVLSTGAAPGLIALAVGKVFGARTIWIDSMANVQELSLSGRMAGRYADLWLTQWPQLAAPDGPTWEGSVL